MRMSIPIRKLAYWIIVPLVLISISFITRFFGYDWFFIMSVFLSGIIFYYVILYIFLEGRRSSFKYFALMMIFSILTLSFTFIGVLLEDQIKNNFGLRTLIESSQGLLQGLCGLYIYIF